MSCCFIWLLLPSLFITDPATRFLKIKQIVLEGNKLTKDHIILRELDFDIGDTLDLSGIAERFEQNKKRILNTGLFNHVVLNIKNWNSIENTADVTIKLQENWFIYPAPIFELADRNFNVWWNEQGRSLKRVNYGLRASHINFTGRKDRLKLVLQAGFTRKYELEYSYPYVNRMHNLGYAANIYYTENKEIGYKTAGNKTVYYRDDSEMVLLRRFRLRSRMFYRPGLFNYHTFHIEFHQNQIDEIIAEELNPDYFLEGKKQIKFFKLEYSYQYDKRIFKLYPEGGYMIGVDLTKEGLGIFDDYNNLSLTIKSEAYKKFHDRYILVLSLKGKTNIIRNKVAFANNTGLGYGDDYVSGYELYVVDGTDFALFKSALRFKIIDEVVHYGKTMPLEQFRIMGIQLYLSMNFDTAFVNERHYTESNDLTNRWFYGYGPGIDCILFNNYLLQFNYSFNQYGENGWFFHYKISF